MLDWLAARHTVHYAPELAQQPHDFRQALQTCARWSSRRRSRSTPLRCNARRCCASSAACRPAPRTSTSTPARAPASRSCQAGDRQRRRRSRIRHRRAAADAAPRARHRRRRHCSSVANSAARRSASSGWRSGAAAGAAAAGLRCACRRLRPGASMRPTRSGRTRRVEPVGLGELLQRSDAVCVLLTYYPRYMGLFGERLLAGCRMNQVWVCLSHSGLFDEAALARPCAKDRWPQRGSTAWSPARWTRVARCATSTRCRSRRASRHDAPVAHPQCLGRRPAHRLAAAAGAAARRVQAVRPAGPADRADAPPPA